MTLVYLGTSLANSIPNPLAERISFCEAEQLTEVKISHDEFPLLLDSLKNLSYVEEVSLVSTCNRFEIYIFCNSSFSESCLLEMKSVVYGINKSSTPLAHLLNDEARLHFFRTYCGLNSGLLTEKEITMQVEIAFGQCLGMKYLARQGAMLLREAQLIRKKLDEQVYVESVSYCQVGVTRALIDLDLYVDEIDKVVILGSGSTALKSALGLVFAGIRPEQITLLHRISSSSDQVKEFAQCHELQGMRFVRCKDGYHIDKVVRKVFAASLVVFAIDSKMPVINLEDTAQCKVIDFNTKSSCTFSINFPMNNFISAQRLEELVREFNQKRLADSDFRLRIAEAEGWILSSVSLSRSSI